MKVSTEILWQIFRPEIYKNYLKQKEIRKLPLEEIQKIQWTRLKKLLEFVYNTSDFYHKSFKSVNLKPQDIVSYKDFQKLPLIDKMTMKKNYDRIITRGSIKQDYVVSYTSGSTGEPFSFLLDLKREEPQTLAAFMLNKENVEIDPFKKYNELMIKAEPINEIKNLYEPSRKGGN